MNISEFVFMCGGYDEFVASVPEKQREYIVSIKGVLNDLHQALRADGSLYKESLVLIDICAGYDLNFFCGWPGEWIKLSGATIRLGIGTQTDVTLWPQSCVFSHHITLNRFRQQNNSMTSKVMRKYNFMRTDGFESWTALF